MVVNPSKNETTKKPKEEEKQTKNQKDHCVTDLVANK
jgi:hypothetical protein